MDGIYSMYKIMDLFSSLLCTFSSFVGTPAPARSLTLPDVSPLSPQLFSPHHSLGSAGGHLSLCLPNVSPLSPQLLLTHHRLGSAGGHPRGSGSQVPVGGSCCNKALLCSLGIDTRNILFTGQKKQPVIVPMYAAGLGMLEPVKPVSAAEMIASIAHNSACSSDSVQEALPPVQFDWSSSGLTNPLDASGGSSLLNLDFFGPVDDSESGAGSIPGVDPELFELTTAKLDSNKMTDAFARLMSSVQSTSTARKPRRDENLSEEAQKVISRFPDLSFMTAKVLMFPTTLTPHAAGEPGPGPGPGPED
ncbi:hypothetical protein WMY93_006779 [Mugilogobius chulae]|uniref:Aftiphilin clathrin-binding box domain-containing protein n=1 Tax=Mugilogobius chulae TaxID=88201 RepID=A0AAW0PWD9_9GOBI